MTTIYDRDVGDNWGQLYFKSMVDVMPKCDLDQEHEYRAN
jgi:hypothetical protein